MGGRKVKILYHVLGITVRGASLTPGKSSGGAYHKVALADREVTGDILQLSEYTSPPTL